MKVAFATNDLIHINAHFGWARKLAIYDVTQDGFQFVETIEFYGDLKEDGNEDKLVPKIEALADCIVSTNDILTKSDFLENPRVPLLEKALQQEISKARAVCAANGDNAEVCAAAWETVNELEAELAFCKGQPPAKSALEEYRVQSAPVLTTT